MPYTLKTLHPLDGAVRGQQEYVSSPPTTDESRRDPFEGRVDGLYLVLISLHGLVRGDRMELGRDPDTGGQVHPWPAALHGHLTGVDQVQGVLALLQVMHGLEPVADRPCSPAQTTCVRSLACGMTNTKAPRA